MDLVYREMIKFGVVGAIAFVVDMGTFNLLRSTLLPHKVTTATIISAAVATVVAWVGNRWWTFRHRTNRPVAHEVTLFFGTNAVAMLIQVGVVAISHYVLHLQSIAFDNAAKVVGIGLGTLFRFWAYRTVVFAGELDEPSAPAEASHRASLTSRAQPSERKSANTAGRADSSSRRPPWASARSRARERPSPEPDELTSRSNTRWAMSAGTPAP